MALLISGFPLLRNGWLGHLCKRWVVLQKAQGWEADCLQQCRGMTYEAWQLLLDSIATLAKELPRMLQSFAAGEWGLEGEEIDQPHVRCLTPDGIIGGGHGIWEQNLLAGL